MPAGAAGGSGLKLTQCGAQPSQPLYIRALRSLRHRPALCAATTAAAPAAAVHIAAPAAARGLDGALQIAKQHLHHR
eukprot:scaffold15645_cov56-Isochrysis_galbana.AAC.1